MSNLEYKAIEAFKPHECIWDGEVENFSFFYKPSEDRICVEATEYRTIGAIYSKDYDAVKKFIEENELEIKEYFGVK